MPLEETAWNLLIIAAIGQRQGGDFTWLEPYWPAVSTWYNFLVTLLPFPGTQLSTDDFDGVLYNATNLAVKGVASIAAYGYIIESYTGACASSCPSSGLLRSGAPPLKLLAYVGGAGNTTAAEEAYATAARYVLCVCVCVWNSCALSVAPSPKRWVCHRAHSHKGGASITFGPSVGTRSSL